MQNKLLLFVLFLSTIGIIAAQNHMDIMTTMTGEHSFASMGRLMTTLDWNGDSHDDLVVLEQNWDPRGYTPSYPPFPYGKLLFYLGGPNFDDVPEIVIPGHHEIEFGHTTSMCNAGDMNHDGYDELALFRATMYEGNSDQQYDLQLCIFYGSAEPDTIPDYVLTFPRVEWSNTYCFVRGLGDINHDGHDELGYIVKDVDSYSMKVGIIYGASMNNTAFRVINHVQESADIIGINDINADGIDDFCLGYGYTLNSNQYQRMTVFFGDSSGIYNDSLLIADNSVIRTSFTYPVGDMNWDGHPEFVSSFTNTSAKLYLGGPGFDGTNYIEIVPPYNGTFNGEGFASGDVNGNGTDDLMGTNVSQADGYGDAYLWMGGVPMNGNPDLHIIPPDLPWPAMIDYEMFGFCLTMGDYNGDGCCDAAISAPFDYANFPEPGHVFVFAGNPQLDDPTPIEDATQIPVISKIQLYPNPLSQQNSTLHVNFVKQSGYESSTFEIYNIRGQKVKSFLMSAEQTKSGSANYNLNDLSSGVYVCTITSNKQVLKGKITIMN